MAAGFSRFSKIFPSPSSCTVVQALGTGHRLWYSIHVYNYTTAPWTRSCWRLLLFSFNTILPTAPSLLVSVVTFDRAPDPRPSITNVSRQGLQTTLPLKKLIRKKGSGISCCHLLKKVKHVKKRVVNKRRPYSLPPLLQVCTLQGYGRRWLYTRD